MSPEATPTPTKLEPVDLIELPSGCTVERPLERMMRFCEGEYQYYDAIPSTNADHIEPIDVLATVSMNSFVNSAKKVHTVHQGMAARCEPLLESIPEDADLIDLETWREPLRELLHQAVQVPGVLIAVATKVLHRKRRFLVPMLDSVLLCHYLASNKASLAACLESKSKAADGAMDAVEGFHQDLTATQNEIQSVRQSLARSGYSLSPVRILEVLIWTQMEPAGGYRFKESG